MEESNSDYLFLGPCDACGSSDAKAVYSDDHTYCFSCLKYGHPPEGTSSTPKPARPNKGERAFLPIGEFRALGKRGIMVETCKKLGYSVTEDEQGTTVQCANWREDGQIIRQKLRYPDKTFSSIGNPKAGLWPEGVWKGGGRMLVITEGEIDALTVCQLNGNKWPVVSLPNGADKSGKGAAKDLAHSLSFVESFDKVVFMFDMDEPGMASAKACASIITPGKAFIAQLSGKDPNAMLQDGKGGDVIQAMWDAKPFRPDGILNANELWDRVKLPKENNSTPYPWEGLNRLTGGNRKGELVVWTAGSGVGKSAVVREVAFDLLRQNGKKIGMIMLEENIERTALGMMGIELNHPLHLDRGEFTEKELHDAFLATNGSDRLWLYDHFGSTAAGNLLDRVRYLANGCECDYIVLDHLSMAVSDAEANRDSGLDERKLIDMLMTKLRSLVEETGVGLHVISHLKRPSGDRGHEDGAMTSLSQLRGSHSIAQLSDMVIGLERNGQDAEHSNETTVRVLKNRFSGLTGVATTLHYEPITGRLSDEVPPSNYGFTEAGAGDDY